jgi:hypothetical protein
MFEKFNYTMELLEPLADVILWFITYDLIFNSIT